MKKLLPLLFTFLAINAHAEATVTAHANAATGSRQMGAVLSSNHTVHIVNNTASVQQYDIYFIIKDNSGASRALPQVYKHHISLNPGQVFDEQKSLQLWAKYNYAGGFQSLASSEVQGESNARQECAGAVNIFG